MKRGRENGEMESCMDMAKCLMLLSNSMITTTTTKPKLQLSSSDVFQCKTCNRKFSSFQALGGHRASHHKKPKLVEEKDKDEAKMLLLGFEKKKPKMHECSICGLEFAMGQALGGHMRRHKAAMAAVSQSFSSSLPVFSKVPAVLKRSNSNKRVMGLDLNLTPLENDLELLFGKMAPKIDHTFI